MSERDRILVAYDGSEFADNAIEDLPRAGLPRVAEALIVFVRERWLPPPLMYEVDDIAVVSSKTAAAPVRVKEEPSAQAEEDEALLLRNAKEKVASLFPEWRVDTNFLQGSAASRITRLADEWGAGLVVAGSHGKTANRLFALGSVSQKIANEAPCSVRIVRGNVWKQGAPSRILIGLDGSETSKDVVEEVAGRMWMMGTEVRLITATDIAVSKNISSVESAQTDKWIIQFTSEARRRLESTELAVSEMIKEGDPKSVIVGAADEWGADCIFIGSSDEGHFYGNLLLGSVATAIVSRANCTVEIVKKRG